MQDNLVQMVRLQIGKEKVKESVQEERQKLQNLADEVQPSKLSNLSVACPEHLLGP